MRLIDFKFHYGLETMSEIEVYLFNTSPTLTFMEPDITNHEEIYREQLYLWLEHMKTYVESNQQDTRVLDTCRILLVHCFLAYRNVKPELKETDLDLLQGYFYRLGYLIVPGAEQRSIEPITFVDNTAPVAPQPQQQTAATAGTSNQAFFGNRPSDDSWAMTNFINEIKCYPEQYREKLLRGLFGLLQPLNAQDPAGHTDYFYITAISRERRGIITDLLAHDSAWSTIVDFLKLIPVSARIAYLSRLPQGDNSFNFTNMEHRVRVSLLDYDEGNVPSTLSVNWAV